MPRFSSDYGGQVLVDASFPEVYAEYSAVSPYFRGQFGGAAADPLPPLAEELVGLYSCLAQHSLAERRSSAALAVIYQRMVAPHPPIAIDRNFAKLKEQSRFGRPTHT